MPFQTGDLILNNRYRIEALLGEGAFAAVYRAAHVDLGVQRAVKVLRRDIPGLGSTEYGDYRQRFQLEFQIAARIDHPNVIKVHDFVEEDGALYAVLELAPGGSLADVLKARGALPPLEVVRLLLDAARGLNALHEQDIVHRDVKPSNILVDAQGRAKIADLGLAQVPGNPLSQHSRLGSEARWHPGTPNYRSPEHQEIDSLLPTADVYSLGCVAFELLTGQVWRWARRKAASVRDLRPETPAWLATIIMRMLCNTPGFDIADANDPAKRYVDMEGVVAALEAGLRPPLEILLQANGKGDYATLEDAVTNLAPGGVIHLAEGDYILAQPLHIEKPLRLQGNNPNTTRIVCSGAGSVLTVTSVGPFSAQGVTFHHMGPLWANIIEVTDGEINLHTCHLTGGIRDEKSRGGSGLWLRKDAQGEICHCRMEQNASYGIEVSDQAQPVLENNVCRENQSCGIGYFGTAGGTARQNTCEGNTLHGITVERQAQPVLENNVCRENQNCGIRYFGTAGGTARQNECGENTLHGIAVAGQAQPVLESNICRGNKEVGIRYGETASGTARQNTCEGNTLHGIAVTDQAQPVLENNVCRENQSCGIGYFGTAGGTARQNICERNLSKGIFVAETARPHLQGNTLRNNKGGDLQDKRNP